jgi:hypothetical protein
LSRVPPWNYRWLGSRRRARLYSNRGAGEESTQRWTLAGILIESMEILVRHHSLCIDPGAPIVAELHKRLERFDHRTDRRENAKGLIELWGDTY